MQGHGRAVERKRVSEHTVKIQDAADGLVLLALFYGLERLGAEKKTV
jgi:hypothetical protein